MDSLQNRSEFGTPPSMKLLDKFEICEGLIADSSFDSSLSFLSSPFLDFLFLLSSCEVLIAEKKKQTSLSFDKVTLVPLFANPIPRPFNFAAFHSPNTLKSHNGAPILNCCNNVTLGFISDNFTVQLRARLTHFPGQGRFE